MHSRKSLLERTLSLPGIKHFTLLLAQRFIAGISVIDLLAKKKFLNSLGFSTITNLLGESLQSFQKITFVEKKYLEAIAFLEKTGALDDISIKASEFGLNSDHGEIRYSWWDDCPEICSVLKEADEIRLRVWLDAELLETREELWKFTRLALEDISFLGIAFQAYGNSIFNSEFFFNAIIEPLATSLPKDKTLGLRLCKGAYFSSEKKILRDQKKIRERYLALASAMMKLSLVNAKYPERGNLFLEFATHDLILIRELKNMLQTLGLPKNKFRFAMLYGRQQSLASHLFAEGYNIAIYLPFGPDQIPYICRRLQENRFNLFLPFRNEGVYHVCDTWPKVCSLNT